MCKKIVLFLITMCCFAVVMNAANRKFTLVIDAGHGGHDTGAAGVISKEKNLTLRYALAFGRMVEQNCPDVKVIYTRKTDRFVELYRRAEIANQNKADLFISIHINALPKGRVARGFQTYTLGTSKRTGRKTGVLENLEVAKRENAVIFLEKDYKQTYHGYDPNSPESDIMFEFIQDRNMENSVELAKYMQRYVCQATGRQDLGAQQDNLAVLRLSSMPGCLVECGFISTRDEEQFMNSGSAADKYARGLFNAFLAYRKKHGGNITIPFKAEPAPQKVEIPQIVPQKRAQVKPSKEKLISYKNIPVIPSKKEPVQDDSINANLEVQSDVQPVSESEIQQKPAVQQSSEVEKQKPAAKQVSAPRQAQLPVFKVQFMTGPEKIKKGDRRFKGLANVDCFRDGSMYRYTVGSSSDYNQIYRLRKEILDKFPGSFIIAFKNGAMMNVNEAIKEFKANKRKNK